MNPVPEDPQHGVVLALYFWQRGTTPDAVASQDQQAWAAWAEPLRAIGGTLDVPPEAIRPSDRFGHDIGTDSVLDDTLDRLTVLLLSAQAPRTGVEVERIERVDQYCAAWRRNRGTT